MKYTILVTVFICYILTGCNDTDVKNNTTVNPTNTTDQVDGFDDTFNTTGTPPLVIYRDPTGVDEDGRAFFEYQGRNVYVARQQTSQRLILFLPLPDVVPTNVIPTNQVDQVSFTNETTTRTTVDN